MSLWLPLGVIAKSFRLFLSLLSRAYVVYCIERSVMSGTNGVGYVKPHHYLGTS
jgi:hypothetical protein